MNTREIRVTIGLAVTLLAVMLWGRISDEWAEDDSTTLSQSASSAPSSLAPPGNGSADNGKGKGWEPGYVAADELVDREQLLPAPEDSYASVTSANSNLLVSAADLNKPEFAERARVLDVRPYDVYRPNHIPGAAWVDLDEWLKAFTAGQPRSNWETRIGALGIDLKTTVVIYDGGWSQDAASLRSILRYWGVKDVRLLNGGWSAWEAVVGRLADSEPTLVPRSPKLKRNPNLLVSPKRLPEMQRTGAAQLVDVRCSAAGAGRTAPRSPAHLDCDRVMDERLSTFKSAADLTSLFRSAGIDPSKPIIVCGESLGEAATLAFALELIGADQARVCFAGWD